MRTPYRSRFSFGIIDGYASDSAYLVSLGSSPRRGDAYFNSTSLRYRYYDGVAWKDLSPTALLNVRLIDHSFASVPSGPQTVDGLTANVGDHVVLAAFDDRVYEVQIGAWTLVSLFTAGFTPAEGDIVYVKEGTTYGDTVQWYDGTNWRLLTILTEGTAVDQVPRWDGTRYVANPDFLAQANLLTTKSDPAADASQAQGITLKGGDKIAGTGDGGDLFLSGGSSIGGAMGIIKMSGSSIKADTHLLPFTDVAYDLGSPSLKWRDLYLSGSTIYLDTFATVSGSALRTTNQSLSSTDSTDYTIETGDALGATSNSGDIIIRTGTATGARGKVLIDGSFLNIGSSAAADPVSGMIAQDIYYNTAEQRFKYYDGTSWRAIGGGGGGAVSVTATDSTLTTLPASTPVAGSIRQTDKDTHILIETDFNPSTYKGLSQRFVTTADVDVSSVVLSFTATSASTGAKTVDIVKDDGSGSPSNNPVDIVASSTNSYTTGSGDFTFTFTPFTLIAGTYHIVLRLAASVHSTYGALFLDTSSTPSIVPGSHGLTFAKQQTVVAGAWSTNASNSYMRFQINYSGALSIDGKFLASGDMVLFRNLSSNNNRVYKVTISGPSLTWQLQLLGQDPSGAPTPGDGYYVKYGDQNWDRWWIYSGDQAAFVDHDSLKNANQKLSNLDPKTDVSTTLAPGADNTHDLGSIAGFSLTNETRTRRWRNVYTSGTIYTTSITTTPLDFSSAALNINTSDNTASAAGNLLVRTGDGTQGGHISLETGSGYVSGYGSIYLRPLGGSTYAGAYTTGSFLYGNQQDPRLVVTGPAPTGDVNRGHMAINSTETMAAGAGALLTLGGRYTAGSGLTGTDITFLAGVKAAKANGTAGQFDGYLQMLARRSSGDFAILEHRFNELRFDGREAKTILNVQNPSAGQGFSLHITGGSANGTDQSAGGMDLSTGQSTGTGSSGAFRLRKTAPGTTGSSLNPYYDALNINGNQMVFLAEQGSSQGLKILAQNNELFVQNNFSGEHFNMAQGKILFNPALWAEGSVGSTAGAPAFTFQAASSTGLFLESGSLLGLTVGGTRRVAIDTNGVMGLGTSTTAQVEFVPYTQFTIANNQASPAAIFAIAQATYKSAIVEYEIDRNSLTRFGTIYMCHDGTNTSIVDTGTETGSPGVTFSMDLSGGNMRLLYTSDNTASGTLRYHVRRMSR